MENTYFLTHAHSDESNLRLLDSINRIEKALERSIEVGLSGMALTDHEALGNHYKALEAMAEIKKGAEENDSLSEEEKNHIKNFKLALGNEIYLTRNGLNAENFNREEDRYYHFILIAKDAIGHEQLRILSSRAWIRSYTTGPMVRVPTYYADIEEVVGENPGHLIASTACLGGYLPSRFLRFMETGDRARIQEAFQFCDWGKSVFGDDFYIELQPSEISTEQLEFNKFAIKFAESRMIKTIVATDAHYLKKEDRKIHKEFLNSKGGEREVDEFYSTTYIMSAEEIHEYMDPHQGPEIVNKLLANTMEIMDKIEIYSLDNPVEVPKIDIPFFAPEPLPSLVAENQLTYVEDFFGSENDSRRYLLNQARKGLKRKDYDDERVLESWKRIDIELKQIHDLSLRVKSEMSDYFLTVQKIIEIIWEDGDSIVAPSRGSALGFELCNLLGITQISPIGKEIPLPFWRFLTGERSSLPERCWASKNR